MAADTIKLKTSYSSMHQENGSPLIVWQDDFLSPLECQYIIDLAADQLKRAQVSLDKSAATIDGRSGSNCWLSYRDDINVRSIGQRIANVVGLPLANAEAFQVIHYGESQEYRPHYDAYNLESERGQRCCQYGGQRLVTALVYLNDVAEGGETDFPKLKVHIAPRPGRLAIFYNVDEDVNVPHPSSLHAGKPVLRGEKWAFNMWFHALPVGKKFDFSTGAHPAVRLETLTSRPSNPAMAKTREILVCRVNRASRLFEQARKNLEPICETIERPTCVTYWDTYGGKTCDTSDLPKGTRLIQLLDIKKVSHLSNKKTFARLLKKSGLADLAPATYESIDEAARHTKTNVRIWFVKDIYGTAGKGMYCLAASELRRSTLPANTVIQAGVTDLMVINRRKFTTRIYCLLWSGGIYLYSNGFLVIHGVEYDPKSTDYKVQIDHLGYHDPNSPVQMHELTGYQHYSTYFEACKSMMVKLAPLLQPLTDKAVPDQYTLLGLDVIFQRKGRVKLIEINSMPNFVHTPEINRKVNVPFLTSALETILGKKAEDLVQVC